LIAELAKVASGETKRLMVNMPPGSAKSTYGSVLFPPWVLAQKPGVNIIGASNTSTMAEAFSRSVMSTIRDNAPTLQYGLTRESAEQWETSNRGRYRAAGVGGAIAGTRADLVIIDDPTRSRADAESETVRESQWAWFTGDLRTRLKPKAAIVVIMTRWHPDDLGGRLLERQAGLWKVISLPAIAEDDDALGREPGEWLWGDDDYGYAAELKLAHAEYVAAGAMRDWSALYQQRPVSLEGALFKTTQLVVLETAPVGGSIVRAWDLAATAQVGTRDPDWTAGVKLARLNDGRIVVLDVVRIRGGPDEVEAAIVNTAKQDGHGVRVGLPQDPGQAGKQQVLYLTRKLSGYRIESSPETGDKATRAAPVASQVNVGNVSIVRAPWNAPFIDELAAFPGGMKDDQVDALSRAFSMVVSSGTMMIDPTAKMQARGRR
jgi:predicted phage terminase large subunit-like protein